MQKRKILYITKVELTLPHKKNNLANAKKHKKYLSF
jgi:hypothetical protein